MNPLLLLLLGLGGLMAAAGGGGGTSSSSAAATDPDDTEAAPAPEQPDETPDETPVETPDDTPVEAPADDPVVETPVEQPADDTPAAPIDITMVIWDMAAKQIVTEVSAGETLDFGAALTDTYTFAAEAPDDVDVGSMTLTYQGQTWLQNIHPYTLEDSPIDLAEGDFDVEVTVYAGPNATGAVLGTETIAFSTTSEVPQIVEDEEELQVEEPADDPVDTPADDAADDPADAAADDPTDDDEEQPIAASLTMVVWDMPKAEIVETIEDGEAIDFGTAPVGDYTFAAEMSDGSLIGSMLLEYQGQTWLQNVYPYTLEDSPIDLTDGDFEVTVTAYSGANATGEMLATQTIAFSTTSEAPAPAPVEDPVDPPADDPADEPVEDPADDPVDTPADDPADDPVDDPVDPPADDDDPIVIETPDAPDQSGDGGEGAETDPLDLDDQVEVMTARTHTVDGPDDAVSIKIVSNLNHGNVTVNPDNTFALVLTQTDFIGTQSFTYEATLSDGSVLTETIGVKSVKGVQDAGWGTGESHYVLATDENDNIIVETGENHTKIFVSGSNDALTRADIAQMEGLSTNQITDAWLANSEVYGRSADYALETELGLDVWDEVTPDNSVTSNHLLFERGYEYAPEGKYMNRNADGEDELHPVYIGAYGEGARPIMNTEFLHNGGSKNIVIQGIDYQDGFRIQGSGENVMINDINVENKPLILMRLEGVTMRNVSVTDVHRDESRNGGDWDGSSDREQGMFGNFNDGLLIENTFFDLNGWEQGYDPDGNGAQGQPPSIYNHNIYLGANQTDVTVRDTISMRGASIGLQLRPGGFVEDVVLIDNNIAMNTLGGDYKGAGQVGEYTLINDLVATSAGYRKAEYTQGRPRGIEDSGMQSSLVDVIVAHLANPDDPDELASKPLTEDALSQPHDPYYDDTIIWNWQGALDTNKETERNVEGLDTDVLDDTTIQNFAGQLMGQDSASIDEFGIYMRELIDAGLMSEVDADLLLDYFQAGFGIASKDRTEEETLRFIPNDLADGVRWDNRLNWSTDDLPGTVEGDSVDLGGNHVVYASNAVIDTLDLGDSGELNLYGGKLTVERGIVGDGESLVEIVGAGQLWADGHLGDDLMIDIDGGRFVNTGAVSDASLKATGGETVLATGGAIYGVSDGETLSLSDDTKIGFDDDDGGVAVLTFEEGATVEYTSEDGDLGTIEEFRTGAFGDAPDVRSGIDLGDATLKIDLAGLNSSNGEALMLMDADEIIGMFDEADISGLGGRNATITIDYTNDSVSLTLSNGNGNVMFETVGETDDVSAGEQALWDTLTAGQGVFDENAPDLPEDEDEYLEAS